MSSFYDDASLVVIPSGYKTSKVYAEKPTDGSGDLAFTRTGDTATRVNSAGLIEKVRTNLLTYSNDFSNAAWGKSNATLTGGQSGYDGSANGWKLEATAVNCYISQGTYSVLRNHSIYAKAGTFNLVSIIVGGYGQGVTFNLTTGAVVTNTSSALYSPVITSVGSGWYRISVGIQAAAPTYGMLIAPNDISGGTIAAGEFIYIQAAQTEYNDIATPYIPTTTAAVSVGPVANVPRLDYLGSTCPRLLLEPQRTNLFTFSESFDNAAWTKSATATTITANSTISPSGYQDADTWTINAAGARYVGQTKTVTAGAVTASFFVKKGTSDWFYIRIEDGANYAGYTFNVSTGQLGQSVSSVLTPTASIVDYGNGWYRCIVTTTVAGTSVLAAGWVATSASTISGTLGASLICWGAQLEVGAYATSYIPTLAASATRGADACSKTGISSLIGQTEGTLFVEFNVLNINPANVSRIILSDGTTNNYIFLGINESGSGNLSRLYINNTAASFSLSLFSGTAITVGRHKLALAYKSGSFALYLDGNSVASSATSGTIPATSQLVIGGLSPSSVSNLETFTLLQNILFPTRLTNAQLAELTTL